MSWEYDDDSGDTVWVGEVDDGDEVGDGGSSGGGGTNYTDDLPDFTGYVLDPVTGNYKYTYDDGSTISVDANGNVVGSTDATDTGSGGITEGLGKKVEDLSKGLGKNVFDKVKGYFTKRVPKKDINGNVIAGEFEDETDWAKLVAGGGFLLGASGVLKKPPQLTGYQGGIPTYNTVQQQVPSTYDPTRRPGSSGQRYFTDVIQSAPADVASAKTAVGQQATGLAALNAANPAMQKRPAVTAPQNEFDGELAIPASRVIDRMAPTMKGLESLVNPPTQKPLGERLQYDPNDTRPIYPGPDKTGLTGGPAQPNGGWRGGDIPFTPPPTRHPGDEVAPPQYGSPQDDPRFRNLIDYASGGGITALKRGNYLSGSTDGMADKLPANIEGNQEARLSHGEFVIPADVVSHLGNGNSDAGAERLYSMMDKIRKARTGTKKQGKQINPDKFLLGGSVGYAGGGIMGFNGAGTTGSKVTVPANAIGAESNLSNWAGPYVTDMLGKGAALANTPYQSYSGPLTAGESAGQTAAFNASAGLNVPTNKMGAFTPQTFTADQAQNYMNPYLSAALNPQMEEMRRQSQLNLQPNMAKLTQAGGFGGSRQALLQSESNRNLQTQQNAALGAGYQTAFDKAMGQFNTEQGRGLEAQTANNAYGLQALSKQAELGGQQRAIEQEGIAADKAQFEEERNDPFTKLTFQQKLLQGLPIQAQSNNYQQSDWLADAFTAAGGADKFFDKIFSTTPASSTTTTTTAPRT